MKTLTSFEFGSKTRGSHDWDQLLNGQIYQLEAGKGFTCKATTFLTLARKQASGRGLRLRTASVSGGIVIQALNEAGEVIPSKPSAPASASVATPEKEAKRSPKSGKVAGSVA